MTEQIKSGREFLDEFFKGLPQLDSVDKDVAESILGLYQEGKLSNVNITNELQRIREAKINDKNQ